jgi:hypothetical protein
MFFCFGENSEQNFPPTHIPEGVCFLTVPGFVFFGAEAKNFWDVW